MSDAELDLSVVIPLLNEEASIEQLCQETHEALSPLGLSYEVIIVDDGSTDGSWDLLCRMTEKHPCFEIVRLRRNFKQTAAMSAGFHRARGAIVVPLDADLQNPPAEIPKLLEKMTPEVDVVSGWRKDRKDNIVRRIPSQLANGLISKITGVRLHDYGCTLKAYRREVIQGTKLYGEMHRFIPALASWMGGGVVEVPVAHRARAHGDGHYGRFGLARIIRVVLDLITVKFLLRYATGPMQIFGKIGAVFGVLGIGLFAFLFLNHASYWIFDWPGASLLKRPFWPMCAFMMILFCIQFISMGLLAEIQIRTYHESQDKPIYAIRETRRSGDA